MKWFFYIQVGVDSMKRSRSFVAEKSYVLDRKNCMYYYLEKFTIDIVDEVIFLYSSRCWFHEKIKILCCGKKLRFRQKKLYVLLFGKVYYMYVKSLPDPFWDNDDESLGAAAHARKSHFHISPEFSSTIVDCFLTVAMHCAYYLVFVFPHAEV